jgi:hypothetical protein
VPACHDFFEVVLVDVSGPKHRSSWATWATAPWRIPSGEDEEEGQTVIDAWVFLAIVLFAAVTATWSWRWGLPPAFHYVLTGVEKAEHDDGGWAAPPKPHE